MDKELLIERINEIKNSSYSWELYFFKINRKNNNPYTLYKIRFKNDAYLLNYVSSLIDMVLKFQLEQIKKIENYNGENTKVSCDKIDTTNELIREQWNYFVESIGNSDDDMIKGKYQGYVLEGISQISRSSILFLKMANPVIKLDNKRNSMFMFDKNSELQEITDELCKLYMSVDCIVADNQLYSFNHKFEGFLNIEKTMQKLKTRAIEEIVSKDAFENKVFFEQKAKSYKSPRTFITLEQERVKRIGEESERKKIAKMLNIKVNEDGKFVFNDEKEVSLLIKYLCYKVFKDDETKEMLEASNVTQLQFG